jgi:uncharacterized membrane protein YfcA
MLKEYLKSVTFILPLLFLFLIACGAADVFASSTETAAAAADQSAERHAWWFWPLILLVLSFVLGVFAVLAGVGGGVLYVPIVSGFLPFHLDFVRGAGLIVALAGALAAGPGLLRKGMADLRLAIPMALIASTCAIIGAMIGLSQSLRIMGVYHEPTLNKEVSWQIHRTPLGLGLFVIIGIMAGMFGLGAGWANVPVLNLLLGAPIKISVATSKFLLSITDTSAAWIYLNNGAVLPLMVVPSVVGIMLGSFIGVKVLAVTKPAIIRVLVIGVLGIAGLKALLKGLGIG